MLALVSMNVSRFETWWKSKPFSLFIIFFQVLRKELQQGLGNCTLKWRGQWISQLCSPILPLLPFYFCFRITDPVLFQNSLSNRVYYIFKTYELCGRKISVTSKTWDHLSAPKLGSSQLLKTPEGLTSSFGLKRHMDSCAQIHTEAHMHINLKIKIKSYSKTWKSAQWWDAIVNMTQLRINYWGRE